MTLPTGKSTTGKSTTGTSVTVLDSLEVEPPKEMRSTRLLLGAAISSISAGLIVPWLFSREIALMLGSSESGLHTSAIAQLLLSAAMALPFAQAVFSPSRVRAFMIVAVVFAALMLVWTATVPDSGTFLIGWGLIGASLCAACVAGPQMANLLGARAPEAWTRNALTFGVGVGAVICAVSPKWFDVTWRGALLVVVAVAFPAIVSVGTVRVSSLARAETQPERKRERKQVGESEPLLSVGESIAVVLNVRKSKPAFLVGSAASMMVTVLLLWGLALLGNRFSVSLSARGLCVALGCFGAIALSRFRVSTRAMPFALIAISCVFGFGLTVAPGNSVVAIVLFVLSMAFAGASWAGADQTSLDGQQMAFRSTVAAMRVIFGSFAAVVTIILADTVDRRFGTAAAMGTICSLAASIGFIALTFANRIAKLPTSPAVGGHVDVDDLKVSSDSFLKATPTSEPLLDVRNIDFSYGQVQILFDVSLTVQPGEFVALLGTNGAGKSTLLRVISGQGLPQRGTVYFGGVDVTSLNAVRRVPLGMSQIPGGKAVFGPLTVAENLDLFSESASETPELRAQAIEQAYTTFPRLAERRTQAAETLSGGEQQMLALAKALMTSPRLLCIDELSLGLAPAVVAELLEILRSIHASGTTIVLVEQSLNVALAIADRAVFMEKGEVRYDGPADELRNRDDLLRSVFFAAESGGL
jgi:ABC-type branched-subunit amino acid transport system ATPase component/MFS family permease